LFSWRQILVPRLFERTQHFEGKQEHRVLAVKDFKDKDFEDVLSKETITDTALTSNIASRLEAAKKSSKTISGYIQRLEETSRLLEYRSKTIKEQMQQTTKSLMMTLQQKEQELLAEEENETKKALEQRSGNKKINFRIS